MGKGEDVLLDLSAWAEEGERRTTLPPRPRPTTRRLPRWGRPAGGRLAAGAAALGLALLVVPLPGTGCGSPLSVWRAAPVALPAADGPDLDPAQPAADAEAVRRAQAALASSAAAPVARTTPVPVTRTVVRPGSSAAAARVPELQDAVAQDERDVAAAKQVRDEAVERQQASDDPSSYDAEVAAAQEDLDAAQARLVGDRAALERARREARSTTVVVATTSPAPMPGAAPSGGALRVELVEALAAARRTQAEHLAGRKQALAVWTAERGDRVARAEAVNAALDRCEGQVRGPALLGALGLALGAGAAARSRL